MKFIIVFSSCFFLSTLFCFGQYQITGTISDADTNQPLEFANVFLANTTLGINTDENGNFLLENISEGNYDLVVSYIGYEDSVQKLVISKWMTALKPNTVNLQTVEVKSVTGKKRKRYLKKFKNALLGNTFNATKTKIVNPQVIDIQFNKGELIATANDLIIIDNKALGYRLKFLLEKFSLKGEQVTYAGKPLFEKLQPQDSNEKKMWESNRLKTYLGSARHFYEALVNDKLKEEGFAIYIAKLKANRAFHALGETKSKSILIPHSNKKDFYLKFAEFLQVVYLKEKKESTNGQLGNIVSGLGHPAEKEMISQSKNDVKEADQYKTSYLFLRKSRLKINANGRLQEPELMIEYGDWSNERLADLLPNDYFPKPVRKKDGEEKKMDKKKPPKKKGFVLSNLKIPKKEIKNGGPPKDGIPSIDFPKFISSGNVDFLKNNDRILGLNFNGIAKAYPIKILDRHEIVNDDFQGKPVAMTYCPLCGSGVAIESTINGSPRTFGVSGLLYNSDVLLYDRETESLWSQIMGQAISGKESGTDLIFLPTENTTWGAWKKQFPNSLVLSTETGFNIDYDKIAYEGYSQSQKLLFPVSHSDNQLKNKDQIIGIEIDGQFKAYPFKKIKKKELPIKDTVNGKALLIHFDKKNKSARITDERGEVLSAISMYWFAWVAFHPETEVFNDE